MNDEELFSRADLIERTGVDEDALIFWLRKDLLKSEVTSSRKHRRYRLAELRFARVLKCLRRFGVNVGQMADVLSFLRAIEEMGADLPSTARLADIIASIEEGEARTDFEGALRKWDENKAETLDILKSYDLIATDIGQRKSSVDAWRLFLAFSERVPLGIMVSDSGTTTMQFVTSVEQVDAEGLLLLDLKRIFAGLEE